MLNFKYFVTWLTGGFAAVLAWSSSAPHWVDFVVAPFVVTACILVSSRIEASHEALSRLPEDVKILRQRALSAIREIDELTLAAEGFDGASVRSNAHLLLEEFERTAQSVLSLDRAIGRIDYRELQADAARVRSELSYANGESRSTLLESQRQVQNQVETFERLNSMRAGRVNVLHSTTVGLDAIVTRVAELQAIVDSSGQLDLTQRRLDEAGANLEALRQGFEDAKVGTRSLLEGF